MNIYIHTYIYIYIWIYTYTYTIYIHTHTHLATAREPQTCGFARFALYACTFNQRSIDRWTLRIPLLISRKSALYSYIRQSTFSWLSSHFGTSGLVQLDRDLSTVAPSSTYSEDPSLALPSCSTQHGQPVVPLSPVPRIPNCPNLFHLVVPPVLCPNIRNSIRSPLGFPSKFD